MPVSTASPSKSHGQTTHRRPARTTAGTKPASCASTATSAPPPAASSTAAPSPVRAQGTGAPSVNNGTRPTRSADGNAKAYAPHSGEGSAAGRATSQTGHTSAAVPSTSPSPAPPRDTSANPSSQSTATASGAAASSAGRPGASSSSTATAGTKRRPENTPVMVEAAFETLDTPSDADGVNELSPVSPAPRPQPAADGHTPSVSPSKHRVSIAESPSKEITVPSDQEYPSEIWIIYAPVSYVTRREQRVLGPFRQKRIAALKEVTKVMFADPSAVDCPDCLCESFIMSVRSTFMPESRPKVPNEFVTAFHRLSDKGTRMCIFNESKGMPVECVAVLRVLRNGGLEEGSLGIYSQRVSDSPDLEGYIPLSFLDSVTNCLEAAERDRYVSRHHTVRCQIAGKLDHVEVSTKCALTLHCRSPQKFYVSFIAFDDESFEQWTTVLNYFSETNHAFMRQQQGKSATKRHN